MHSVLTVNHQSSLNFSLSITPGPSLLYCQSPWLFPLLTVKDQGSFTSPLHCQSQQVPPLLTDHYPGFLPSALSITPCPTHPVNLTRSFPSSLSITPGPHCPSTLSITPIPQFPPSVSISPGFFPPLFTVNHATSLHSPMSITPCPSAPHCQSPGFLLSPHHCK